MTIKLQDLGHHYNFHHLFKGINASYSLGDKVAVLGPNGTGKSTFLKILISLVKPTSGEIEFPFPLDTISEQIVYTAPALELIEDYSLEEMLAFHFQFKKRVEGITDDQIIEELKLEKHRTKALRNFSSGMQQRVKLALVFNTDAPIWLLDEPCSNLDKEWIRWYQDKITKVENRLIFVASNDEQEYQMCDKQLNLKR